MNPERLLFHYERTADAPDAILSLRRFTLDLAVRGKLVPQDPKDEPARELLRRIAKEKARRVRLGQIRKSKALPEIEETAFDLPHPWCWTRIREVTSDRGQTVPEANFTYIDVTAIDKENGIVANPKVLPAKNAPSRARKITRKGDVIYSCVRPYLLNVAVIEDDFDPAPIASTAFAILDGLGLVLPRYLWIVLRSPFMVERVESCMRGQAYPAINDADFAVLPLPLPPFAEQQRIVAKVDELMALCDELGAARAEREAKRDRLATACHARLSAPDPDTFQDDAQFVRNAMSALTTRPDQIKQIRQTILTLGARGKLVQQWSRDEPASELLKRIAKEKTRLVRAGEIKKAEPVVDLTASEPDIPIANGWAVTNLQSVCVSVTDGDHLPPPKTETGVPFLVIGNVRSRAIDFSQSRFVSQEYYRNLDSIRRPKNGDLLYTLVGSYGIPVVVRDDRPFCVQRHIGILRPCTLIDVNFLALAMESELAFGQATAYATGIAQKTVPLSGLRKLLLPLPPLTEQHRIVARVNELMHLCDQLAASLAAAEAGRSRLLNALLQEALAPAAMEEAA